MILRQIGANLYIELELSPGVAIEHMLQENPTLISTTDLNSSSSGYYSLVDELYIPNEDKELEELTVIKLEEVFNKFENDLKNGTMLSSLGFTVDNRRYADKNDKDNVQGLIDLGILEAQFKDADGGFHIVSAADLETLKLEMTQDGLGKYQVKWGLENLINNCTTLLELESINTQ